MKRLSLFATLIFLFPMLSHAQMDCIGVDSVVCHGTCVLVTYTGTHGPDATYAWSSSCGTFEHPDQQNPGEHCFLFQGSCTLTVIVTESGMDPDTCTKTVTVSANPDGLISDDTTICSGTCAQLNLNFTGGTPPFVYQIDDGTFVNFYTAGDFHDSIPVCPSVSTTYTLVSIVDANMCMGSGPFNSVDITVTPGIDASVTQNGAFLCANPPGQHYQWYDCGFTQLQSVSQCFALPADGCYCLIVSDAATGFCVDTVCGDYMIPCDITCGIAVNDSFCLGDSVMITFSGSAPATAVLEWFVDFPHVPDSMISGVDTLIIPYDTAGCYHVSLTVTDGPCVQTCIDSFCVFGPFSTAGFGADTFSCDSCLMLPVFLEGASPWTIVINHGADADTIAGIVSSPFYYEVCPPKDTAQTYVLSMVTDSVGLCPVLITDDSVMVIVNSIPVAGIVQNGNYLCATSSAPEFAWYDCAYTQLLSFDSCLAIVDTGCFCLILTNGYCQDTFCGDFIFTPCQTDCSISLVDKACTGSSVVFAFDGNVTDNALFTWLIDVPGDPQMLVFGVDTVVLTYEETGCYGAVVRVFDEGCESICTDTVCIEEPSATATLCCATDSCAACTDLTIDFTGTPPWQVVISDDHVADTIADILTTPLIYTVCPPADSIAAYSILSARDSSGICMATLPGNPSVLVTLHDFPLIDIVQTEDTLCAAPATLDSYAWYACGFATLLSDSACFVPSSSGCYCVIATNGGGCADTACYDIILSDIPEIPSVSLSIWPNPVVDKWQVHFSDQKSRQASWTLFNTIGQPVAQGLLESSGTTLRRPDGLPAGGYLFQIKTESGYTAFRHLVFL